MIIVLYTILSVCWQTIAWGKITAPSAQYKYLIGFITTISWIVFATSSLLFIWQLTVTTVSILLLFLSVLPILFQLIRHQPLSNLLPRLSFSKFKFSIQTQQAVSLIVFLSTIILYWLLLIRSSTNEAIRSPWEATAPLLILLFTVLTISFLSILLSSLHDWIKIIIVSLYSLAFTCTAALVYRLGYGFDPFIHTAALKLIVQQGEILPKTVYYNGYYGLSYLLNVFLGMPLSYLNKWLVPIIYSVLVPTAAIISWRSIFKGNKKPFWLSSLVLFFLPLSLFIQSTPYSLAIVLTLVAVFLSLAVLSQTISFLPVIAITIAVLSIHPLAGLPLFFFVCLLGLTNIKQTIIRYFSLILTTIIGVLTLPLVILFSNTGIASQSSSINQTITGWIANLFPTTPFFTVYDWLDRYQALITLLIIITAIGGCIYLYKRTSLSFSPWLLSSVIAIGNGILLSLFSFTNVIWYEQETFPSRLLHLFLLFLLPLSFIGIYRLLHRFWDSGIRTSLMIVTAMFLITSWRLSYPRLDPNSFNRGYSTSIHDIQTVRTIAKREKQTYLVLANQAVSAAAIQELGFTPTYNGQYFYPVPTGGWLYQYYLKMVYENPKKETIQQAMERLGVEVGYLVVNDYWNKAEEIIRQAKQETDEWFSVDNKIFVFRFR
ncbi:MAG: hypothetical protein V1707_02580 [bacterium]